MAPCDFIYHRNGRWVVPFKNLHELTFGVEKKIKH